MLKGLFKRYWRTIGVFAAWLLLSVFFFGALKEEPDAVKSVAFLILLVILEYGFGYGRDKIAAENARRKKESERQMQESMGESEWREYRIEKKGTAKRENKLMWKTVYLDLAMGGVYMTTMWLNSGNDPRWLRDAVPALVWFLFTFPVFAAAIITLPKKITEGKVVIWNILFVAPFILFPFIPHLSNRIACFYITFTLGMCFSVMGIGYMHQTRHIKDVCTVMTTAKVIGNIKSLMDTKQEQTGDLFIPTYQPVLEYYVEGEQKQMVCRDGFPTPFPLNEFYSIYYNPEKPDEVRFADRRTAAERYIGPVFLGIGAVLMVLAVVLLKLMSPHIESFYRFYL